jgi:hypothetical protein
MSKKRGDLPGLRTGEEPVVERVSGGPVVADTFAGRIHVEWVDLGQSQDLADVVAGIEPTAAAGTASQRDDRALERPPNLTGGAAGQMVAKLRADGLVEETPSSTSSEQNVAKDVTARDVCPEALCSSTWTYVEMLGGQYGSRVIETQIKCNVWM